MEPYCTLFTLEWDVFLPQPGCEGARMPPLGMSEILLVAVVAAVVFGHKKIPGLGKSLGQGVRNFKRSLNEPDEIDVTPKKEEGSTERKD